MQVLDLIKEISDDRKSEPGNALTDVDDDADVDEDDVDALFNGGGGGDDGGSNGYHSDSESAVMTSGNSPFISKEARYNFLSRSGKKSEVNNVTLPIPTYVLWRNVFCT